MAKKILVGLVLMMVFLATTSSVAVAHPLCTDNVPGSPGGDGSVVCNNGGGVTCTFEYTDTDETKDFSPGDDITNAACTRNGQPVGPPAIPPPF